MKNMFDQKNINLIFLSVLLFIFGFLFFAFYNNWIILFLPSYNIESVDKKTSVKQEKRDVALYFWKDKRWNKEEINLLWSKDNDAENIKYLINGWLNLTEEESHIPAANLQSVLISSSGQQAYLSFDRNPLPQEGPVYDKLMFIEGILKTIRENGVNIQGVFFLAHHQIMRDYHLDFSKAWPVNGFF
jgi:hypothetical protein